MIGDAAQMMTIENDRRKEEDEARGKLHLICRKAEHTGCDAPTRIDMVGQLLCSVQSTDYFHASMASVTVSFRGSNQR